MTIAGLPPEACEQVLAEIRKHPEVKRVVLYGSRALGRHRSGSDVDLCLDAPDMTLKQLLNLGARLDDLLLPWRFDLQLNHLITHTALRDHIERAGQCVWQQDAASLAPPSADRA